MAPEAPRMIAIGMSKRKDKSHGHANRTPWRVAAREVPAAWLEDEAKHSPSPYSLLASWKGGRGGGPSHVMIKLLRRRLREEYPELMGTSLPPTRLQRAHDMLKMIWHGPGRGTQFGGLSRVSFGRHRSIGPAELNGVDRHGVLLAQAFHTK
jgi:hypothetical protein